MRFEDENAALRQMKELLRDQAKFRAKLDRVVRKIETSSERTAKLAERNKLRKKNGNGSHKSDGSTPGNNGSAGVDGDGQPQETMEMSPVAAA